jgi:hypothetical protein
VKSLAGARVAGIFKSLLDGMADTQRFYEGRVFGYGEFPGCSSDYFPMLKKEGFERTADWYSSNFIRPIVSRLRPSTFYRNMFDLSLEMVMLHLDSRLVFHAFRLEGGKAQLPFLDTRIVNFFTSLPYGYRAFYRAPKYIIRTQLRHKDMCVPANLNGRNAKPSTTQPSIEQLMLGGSLGAYVRGLLHDFTFADRVSGLFDLVDERYVHDQLASFRKGERGTDYKFISRLAALELWSRSAGNNQLLQ